MTSWQLWLPIVVLIAAAAAAGGIWALRRRPRPAWENTTRIQVGVPLQAVATLLRCPPGDYAAGDDAKFVVADIKPKEAGALTQVGNSWTLAGIRQRQRDDRLLGKPRRWWIGDSCIILVHLDRNEQVQKVVIARPAGS